MDYQWLSFKQPPKVEGGYHKSHLLDEERKVSERLRKLPHRHTALGKGSAGPNTKLYRPDPQEPSSGVSTRLTAYNTRSPGRRPPAGRFPPGLKSLTGKSFPRLSWANEEGGMEPARAPDQMHSTHARARSHTRAHTHTRRLPQPPSSKGGPRLPRSPSNIRTRPHSPLVPAASPSEASASSFP